ncbi:Asparagine synthetase [glutamine-hydrolyzing] AsnH [hydrothermal vent metagenome]|uniref:Asparagine synthetase [glutamine-hydrolyzing] AsnH n=1 Tax=hydrothermal vent metagenome TaxID=652676 RepID=A0A3B1ATI6_9ZZZZ
MCGIAGIITSLDRKPDQAILKKMTDAIIHRGPDEAGIYVTNGVGLGHRRLSIIDLESGQQPMTTSDRDVTITYNGEIYNFMEIRADLEAKGYHFKTRCDTEVILYAYHAWGPDSVKRIRGMFAYVIYDNRDKTIFMARDRLGIKPLFYAHTGERTILFGSELKALAAHPKFVKSLRKKSMEDYFALGYVAEPNTIYENVHKLEPGHSIIIDLNSGNLTKSQYWNVQFTASYQGSFEEAKNELQERIHEAVKIRMVADVPLGAFLSGGVDSGAVVADMADISDEPVNSCSIGFSDPKFNETDYADRVAEQYKTNHWSRIVDPGDYSLVEKLIDIYDEPYADSSALPTYRVCELAREKVIVALSGDGGDENLAGYRRYQLQMFEQKIRGILPDTIRKPLFGLLGRLYPKADWAPRIFRAKTTFQGLARDHVESYFHGVSIFKGNMRDKLFSKTLKNDLQGYNTLEVFNKYGASSGSDDPLSILQYIDLKTYLVGDILTKVDRASMAHSLEVRVPLLDHKLVEWIATLPSDFKLQSGEGKYIFKKSLEGRLPEDILYRPKMGFGVPLGKWFRDELKQNIRDAVLSERMLECGYFNADYLHDLVNHHQSGMRDYSSPLWTLMMFDQFLSRQNEFS